VHACVCVFLYIAQLDMRKSAGLLALEELLKAQETQMKLNRQFQHDRMKDLIRRRREVGMPPWLGRERGSDL